MLTALPILLAAAGTTLGLWAAADVTNAPTLRVWAIVCAVVLAVLLVVESRITDERGELFVRLFGATFTQRHLGPAERKSGPGAH